MTTKEKIQKQISELRKVIADANSNLISSERNLKKIIQEEQDVLYKKIYEDAVYQKSDYAGFSAGEYSFYYGYEELEYHPLLTNEKNEDSKKTWTFVVSKNGKQIYRKAILPEHIDWDCAKGLLVGIAYWLNNK